ncbi:MAG: alpha-galactosidase [Caldilineaceae bacterium]|nr:alpha-galactosidase [Caldilineaceae bacterium]MCB9157552.1 alpha-galactosidase [Caldilineaceae bacterium]
MPKIAIIGAGSAVFARRLITDFLSFPSLQNSQLALMDIDPETLATITAWTENAIAQNGLGATVQSTLDRREALRDADYVIISIRVGGVDAVFEDFRITSKYGVDHSVGDTMGPGGVFYFLRNGAEIVNIARDMEELCPNALMLNYTNPMVMICWAVSEMTSIRNVGLCHSVQGTAFQLADYMGIARDELRYWTAGINHMAWYLKLEHNGRDVYPQLYAAMQTPDIYAKDNIRFEIMKHFGAFVTESTRHMSEYVPYFRRTPALLEQYELPSSLHRDWSDWLTRRDEKYEQMVQEVADKAPVVLDRTHEYCSFILNAIETDTPFRFNGNVTNHGVISNLPSNALVEVPILADGTGLHPCYVGALPPELAALNRTNLNVQEVVVEALKRQDRELVYRAVQLDPLTSAVCTLDDARRMVDELFAAHEAHLTF